MGKWIAAVVAVLVLGGAGFAIYKLTNIPEQAKEWWDEKKLDNFETLANREIADFEGKITGLKDTLHKKEVERVLWAGDPKLGDANYKEQKDTRFKTLLGYTNLIAWRSKQGEALAAAYKAKAKEGGVDVAAGTTDLKPETMVSVELPIMSYATGDYTKDVRDMKAAAIMEQLGNIETELTVLETEKKGVEEVIAQYDVVIKEVGDQIGTMEKSLKDMGQQVKLIAAQIKVQKAKEDLAELNKAIRGQGGKSELGDMIAKYEQRKTKFTAEEIVSAEKKADSKVSLSDLDKPTGTTSAKTSRFMK